MYDEKECCGKCKYASADRELLFTCNNENSDYYTDYTDMIMAVIILSQRSERYENFKSR